MRRINFRRVKHESSHLLAHPQFIVEPPGLLPGGLDFPPDRQLLGAIADRRIHGRSLGTVDGRQHPVVPGDPVGFCFPL